MKFCKCNKCNLIMIDENPGPESKEYAEHIYPNAVDMARDNTGFPVCPECMDDGELVDL